MNNEKKIDIDNIDWSKLNPNWNEHYNPVTQERHKMTAVENDNAKFFLKALKKKGDELEELELTLVSLLSAIHTMVNEEIRVVDEESLFTLLKERLILNNEDFNNFFKEIEKLNKENSKNQVKIGTIIPPKLIAKYLKKD